MNEMHVIMLAFEKYRTIVIGKSKFFFQYVVFIRTSGFEKSSVSTFARGFCSSYGFHCSWHATMDETPQFRLTSFFGDFGFYEWSMLRIHGYVYSGMLQNAPECAGIR